MKLTLKILSILSIAGILFLSFFSWYSCDDFCNIIELARYPVLKFAWLQYMHWDGRSISVAAFVQLFSLKYFPVELTTFIWALSFVASGWLIFKIVKLETSAGFENMLAVFALLCATLWLGLWKLIPDIIYWPTGGSYSLLNFLGLLWLYVFLRGLKKERHSKIKNAVILFVSFICGVNSHNFILGLILLCLLEWWQYGMIRKDRQASYFISCSLIGLLAGACIVFFAPGNQTRLSIISYGGLNSKFLYFYFLVLAKYCYWLAGLFVLCFLTAWLSGSDYFHPRNYFLKFKERIGSIPEKNRLFEILYRNKYLLAALSTIIVFMATSFFAVPRTAIFFASFFVIYFFQHAWKAGGKFESKRFITGSILSLSVFLCVIIFQAVKANSLKQQLAEREQLFSRQKGADVVVTEIAKNNIPFAFALTDVSADTGFWVNRCVAQHYELKTVRAGSYDEKK